MQRMGIETSVRTEDSDDKQKKPRQQRIVGLLFLVSPFFVCYILYLAVQQHEAQQHEDLNRYRAVKSDVAKSKVGGQMISLKSKHVLKLRDGLANAVTTMVGIGLETGKVRIRMLENPGLLKHTKLPRIFFGHTSYFVAGANLIVAEGGTPTPISAAALKRLHDELARTKPVSILNSSVTLARWGRGRQRSTLPGFTVMYRLGPNIRFDSSASGGGFGGKGAKQVEDSVTRVARHFGQISVLRWMPSLWSPPSSGHGNSSKAKTKSAFALDEIMQTVVPTRVAFYGLKSEGMAYRLL